MQEFRRQMRRIRVEFSKEHASTVNTAALNTNINRDQELLQIASRLKHRANSKVDSNLDANKGFQQAIANKAAPKSPKKIHFNTGNRQEQLLRLYHSSSTFVTHTNLEEMVQNCLNMTQGNKTYEVKSGAGKPTRKHILHLEKEADQEPKFDDYEKLLTK